MGYGNCLIAAIIAKIKDPKNVEIKIIPKYLNRNKNAHFVWINKNENKVYHYIHATKSHFNLFYKGKLKSVDKVVFDKFMLDRITRYTNDLRDKLTDKFDNHLQNNVDWHVIEFDGLPSFEDGEPFTKRVPVVEVLCGTKPDYYTKFVKLEPNKQVKLPDDAFMWRYQSIFTETFSMLWFDELNNDYLRNLTDFAE